MDNQDDVVATARFPGGHALVVAVAAYPNVPPLPTAVINDAREVAATLTSPAHCGYEPRNVTLLLNEQVTLDALRSELAALAARAKPDDTVMFFFSGHGARLGAPSNPESALIPVDCDLANLASTVLPEAELSAALARIKAQRVVVLIDACHSGGVGSFKTAGGIQPLALGFSEKSLEELAKGTGRVLIASSRASETSLVLAGASNSLFTQHLVAALRGSAHTRGDGLIRIFEIFNYVSEQVRNAAPGRQHPIFKASDLEDNFVVALERGGSKSAANASATTASHDRWRQLEEALSDLYPAGPQDQEIWARAGGDLSRLRLSGTGRANWFAALRILRQGGGGAGISQDTLVKAVQEDFPHHPELLRLISGS
ncbi:caspase family protein [Corallococcus sp. AB038B]|uniref:caspase family protein n=1 Tax=Corallococcus sp. AB038B TaxID=2316718 RepID=UPI000EE21FF8|nr:caspase family protein [Corallococcus sp. AB038B]RKI04415.1 caspase family protein [Corallococcus sp. AB038B]